MDLVVSRIRVLQDNYIETVPSALQDFYLGPQVSGIPLTRQKSVTLRMQEESVASSDIMDNIYDRENENLSVGNNEQDKGKKLNDTVSATDSAEDMLETDAHEPPTLTVDNINTLSYESSSINSNSNSNVGPGSVASSYTSLPVSVVDSMSTITAFAAAVRHLSLQASSAPSNASIKSETIYLPYYCVISCYVLSCLIISCLIVSCRIVSYHIVSHHITSHHITSHHITSHHITSHHITSCHIIQHYVIFCASVSLDLISCYFLMILIHV